jgi:hypothetical protein
MPNLKSRACTALAVSLARTNPAAEIDAKGYVGELGQNVVSGIEPADLAQAISDLEQGGGKELDRKIRAAHSSAMLAVNAFAAWRTNPAELPILPQAHSVRFECKLTMGLKGQPPNLDLVAEAACEVVAVESKLTEHLGHTEPRFAASVVARMHEIGHLSWRARLQEDHANPAKRRLDRAQLLKHYLGIKTCFPKTPATLLYIFWEPRNWAVFDECTEHRAEVVAFARGLADPLVRFRAMSYAELWASWDGPRARALAERYLIDV